MIRKLLTQDIGKLVVTLVTVAAFLLGGGFFWNQLWNIPNLVYAVLPAYDVPGQSFGGLVVENRGRATAHEVLVKASNLPETIDVLEIQSDEAINLQSGGQGSDGFEISLSRLAPGASLTVYMLTKNPLVIDSYISVTAEEDRGVPVSEQDPGTKNALIFVVAAILA